MSNGVNIIETIPIMTNYFSLDLAWLILALFVIWGTWEIYRLFKMSFDKNVSYEKCNSFVRKITITSTVAAIIMLLLVTIGCIYKPDYTGKNQYRVEITDSASFNEIYNNYEILEQDGNVYLIEEKE